MGTVPELKLTLDDKPTGISILLAWAARLAIVAAFVFIGVTKFNRQGEWVKIFALIGWGQWFRYFTGTVQIVGAILMLTPWTMTFGAFLLGCTMVGAVVVDIAVMHAVGYALLPLILLGIIVATWFTATYGAISRA